MTYRIRGVLVSSLLGALLVSAAAPALGEDAEFIAPNALIIDVSTDGRTVVITTESSLLPEDVDDKRDAYVFDANTGLVELLGDIAAGNGSRATSLSGNGRFVMWTAAGKLLRTDLATDEVTELAFGEFQPTDVTDDGEMLVVDQAGIPFFVTADGSVEPLAVAAPQTVPIGVFTLDITPDGDYVLIGVNETFAQEFYPDTLYLWHRASQRLELVSVDPLGFPYRGVIHQAQLATDGLEVTFITDFQLVVYDVASGQSHTGPGDVGSFGVSDDGYVYWIPKPPQLGTSEWVVSDRAFSLQVPLIDVIGPVGGEVSWVDPGTESLGLLVEEGADTNAYAIAASPGFLDAYASIFRNDIVWLDGQGLTSGCNLDGTLFCPSRPVTRGELAALFVRRFDLPATMIDFFHDDDGHLFEEDINRLAAAGITAGCDIGRFCPDAHVTRGQVAAFFVRALQLPVTDVDFFTDDEGTLFEGDIDRLAAAGITKGCSATTFCPDRHVSRGELAAFLHRAAVG